MCVCAWCACVCTQVFLYPCVHLCVLCVCTLTRRRVCLISTPEHSSGLTFSAIPHSNQTLSYTCYLHSTGCWEGWLMRLDRKKLCYRHADPLIRYVAFFLIIFPEIGSLFRQTFLSFLPNSKSWNNKVTPTVPLEVLAFRPPGTLSGSWSNVVVGLWTGMSVYVSGILDFFFSPPLPNYSRESTYVCVTPLLHLSRIGRFEKTAEQPWLREMGSSESGTVDTANRIMNCGKLLPLPHWLWQF